MPLSAREVILQKHINSLSIYIEVFWKQSSLYIDRVSELCLNVETGAIRREEK